MSDDVKTEEQPAENADAAAEAPAAAEQATQEAAASEAPANEAKFDKLDKAKKILNETGPGNQRGPRGPRRNDRGGREEEDDNTFEKVVHINRCAKAAKGGRRFSFSALVVAGDQEGQVGFGFGKAQEVSECIKKASEASRKDMVKVQITENTIPHSVVGEHGGGRVLLRPASPGTGLIAGGGVRAVVEAAGIKDVLAKSLGSNNQANVVKATLDALQQLRNKKEIYSLRGKKTADEKAL